VTGLQYTTLLINHHTYTSRTNLHLIGAVTITIRHRTNVVCLTPMFLSIPISFRIRGEEPFHDVGRVTAMSTSLAEHYRLGNGIFTNGVVNHERH